MKTLKRAGKITGVILIAILALILIGYLVQTVCWKAEKTKIANSYGQMVEVFGNNMCVDIVGSGNDVVVILPGAAESSPILYFKPLAEKLSETYTVVTIEYLGYGLSDSTDRKRTVENVSEELHECLSQLGYGSYILMAHSYSGIAATYYTNQYPDEIRALVGIDSTVAEQNDYYDFKSANLTQGRIFRFLNDIGLIRLVSKFNPGLLINQVSGYEYSEDDSKLFRMLCLNTLYTDNMFEKISLSDENAEKTEDMVIPMCIVKVFYIFLAKKIRTRLELPCPVVVA